MNRRPLLEFDQTAEIPLDEREIAHKCLDIADVIMVAVKPVLTKTGKQKSIAWQNTYLKNDTQNIMRTMGSKENITECKSVAEALIENRVRCRLICKTLANIISVNKEKIRFDYNQYLQPASGCPWEERS